MSTTRPEITLHPPTLAPSSLTSRVYDLIVIGGGPTGEMAAMRATRGGLTALLVESELVGGECPYWACVPSKALLRPRETLEGVRAVGGARERLRVLGEKYGGSQGNGEGKKGQSEIDLPGVWARRDFFAKNWEDSANLKLMADHGVSVVRGFGRIAGVKRVSVQGWGSGERVEFEARHAVAVCTGTEPVMPDIPGLLEARPWTSREAVSASEVPDHLVVLGGGPVAAELATAYRQLGSEVTLIVSSARLLARFEPEAGKRVVESLVKSGVDVRLSSKAASVQRSAEGVVVTLDGGETITGSEILVATGRKAKTTDIGLEAVGLPGNGARIAVDNSMCSPDVAGGWLYAVGDTNGISPLTHMGKYQGKIAGDSIVAKARGTFSKPDAEAYSYHSAKASSAAVPQVTFTDPQVASVGLTAAQARTAGLEVKIAAVKMAGPGTFLHAEGYDGWAQWVVEEPTGRLLGATFVGRDVVDLLHASTVAVVGRMTVEQLWHAVPSFPTMGETYTTLLEACGL